MHKIIHPKEVESATVKIKSGNKSGTAFFITTIAKENFLLTAEHNIPEDGVTEIIVSGLHPNLATELSAIIVKKIPEKDVALLRLLEPITEIEGLPLAATPIAYDQDWESFGFPAERPQTGGRYNGKVSRINTGTKWDIDLNCVQYGNLSDFAGLSGAPLVIGGLVCGIIGYDLSGTLGATSLTAVFDLLNDTAIHWYSGDDAYAIPDSISEESKQTTPNDEVLAALDEMLANQPNDHYYLLSGNPGCGKTTIIAQFEPNKEQFVTCDRYFIKVPDRENIPTQVRATPDFFMDWAAGVYTRLLYDSPPAKTEKKWNERLQEIRNGFRRLSDHFRSMGKTGILLIDGLDDVDSGRLDDFLSFLPDKSCTHVKVILSCTSKHILPGRICSELSDDAEVQVTPLNNQQVLQFFSNRLSSKSLTFEQLTKLSEKSEGYPIYMRYLEKYVLDLQDISQIDNWISQIPRIGGDIEIYYKAIWSKFEDKPTEIWVAATIANFRHEVSKDILYQILSPHEKIAFPAAFPKLQHLLKSADEISIYHNSFSDFVKTKTAQIGVDIHHAIASYCLQDEKSFFSTADLIYHLLKGNAGDQRGAVAACNQSWADNCTMKSVDPELVLSDIKNAIEMAAEFSLPSEVIRLLLLSQRINFRYNDLFEENATFLVSALLALKRPEAALRYAVRNDSLTVSDGDALFLLQRFFEYGATSEGDELYNTIKKTSLKILDAGLTGESFERFAELRFNSLALAANLGPESLKEYERLKESTVDLLEANNNDAETIHQFKDRTGSYQYGYLIWRFGIPALLRKQEELFKSTLNNKTAGYLGLCINRAKQFKNLSVSRENRSKLGEWVEDMEYAIEKYGTHPDYDAAVIAALLPDSKRPELAEPIISRLYAVPAALDLRDENGVDVNKDNVHSFLLHAESTGYVDHSDNYPKLLPLRYAQWEDSLKRQYEYVYFLTGKIHRLRAEKKSEEIARLKPRLMALVNNLRLDLSDRQHWQRSYAIPENLLPYTYRQLTTLFVLYFPEEISALIDPIAEKKDYQLGIYTEGYIDTLFAIISALDEYPQQWTLVFKLAKLIEECIMASVENRYDRNEYLLRLVEIYARMENYDQATQVFQLMIDYSMGPSWYKESQLGLINSTINAILPDDNKLSYLQKFAAHLHHASGEMTFQRYVKQQQEDFAGDLAQAGLLSHAIAYFKYLVFPDYKTIIENAETGFADMPIKGNGYVLGARSIEEQAGILRILSGLNTTNSLAVWGLAELQALGDERYLDDFAEIQANILNNVAEENELLATGMYRRIARFTVNEVDPEHRPAYLSAIMKKLREQHRPKLDHALKAAGLNTIKKEKNTTNTSGSHYSDPLDKLLEVKISAESALGMGNISAARQTIITALRATQGDKYSIWSDFYSERINAITSLFPLVYDKSTVFIKEIKPLLVNEPYDQEWILADKLIRIMEKMVDESEKKAIIDAVEEHIQLMVRTPGDVFKRYEWFTSADEDNRTPDRQLAELLIWFLNHPDLIIKNRTLQILTWLGNIDPESLCPVLFDELIKPGYRLSRELSASVLHQMAIGNSGDFWLHFRSAFDEREKALLESDHFMIINSLIEVMEHQEANNADGAVERLRKLRDKFIGGSLSHSDVYFDEDYLEPISGYLAQLGDTGILSGKFAKSLIENIGRLLPIPIVDCLRANEYINRSFNDYNDLSLIPDFEGLLRFCLNVTVTAFVPDTEHKKIAAILRYYQPTFPELILSGQLVDQQKTDDLIKQLVEKKTGSAEVLYSQETILHYWNEIYDKHDKNSAEYECHSYLVPVNDWNDYYSFQPESLFSANGYPNTTPYEHDDICIPLVTMSMYVETVGSDETPSQPLVFQPDAPYAFITSSSTVKYWRNGRNWDQKRRGQPLSTGYSVTIPRHKLNKLKAGFKLIMAVSYNYQFAFIDVFSKKIIA